MQSRPMRRLDSFSWLGLVSKPGETLAFLFILILNKKDFNFGS